MKIKVLKNSEELGKEAATLVAKKLNEAIEEKGNARLLLSTGASQFDTLKALVKMDVNWSKVEMFHLDEYVGLPESHPASFRKYLKVRFTEVVNLKKAIFVNGEGNIEHNIHQITDDLRKAPVDVALVGIGENTHIAFNDPPANFETEEAYRVVDLDDKCKTQQIREGWFASIEDVPKQAITMTVYQIMQSKAIITCVPHKEKANAIKLTLENDLTNEIPATMLKKHENWTLFIDENSASSVNKNLLGKYI